MTNEKQFRQDQTKKAIVATIEAHYQMTYDQKRLLEVMVFGLLEDIKDYPIQYAD